MYILNNLCRVCVSSTKLINLYNVDLDMIPLFTKLQSCFPTVVREDPNMPTYICEKCLNFLRKVYTFRQICLRGKGILEGYISQLKDNNPSVKNPVGELSIFIKDLKYSKNENLREHCNIATVTTEVDILNSSDVISTEVNVNKEVFVEQIKYGDSIDKTSIGNYNSISMMSIKDCTSIKKTPEVDCNSISILKDCDTINTIFFKNSNPISTILKEEYNSISTIPLKISDSVSTMAIQNCNPISIVSIASSDDLNTKCNENIIINQNKINKAVDFQSHHLEDPLKLDNIEQNYSDCEENHLLVKNISQTLHICEFCSYVCDSLIDLNTHVATHTQKLKLNTNLEKVEIKKSSQNLLDKLPKVINENKNIPTSSKLGKIKCDICSLVCVSASSLQNHIRMHTNEKPYKCDLCTGEFRRKYNLRIHKLRTHTPDSEKKFKCKLCVIKFARKADLSMHEKKHEAKKPRHTCNICKNNYSLPEELYEHKEMHRDDNV